MLTVAVHPVQTYAPAARLARVGRHARRHGDGVRVADRAQRSRSSFRSRALRHWCPSTRPRPTTESARQRDQLGHFGVGSGSAAAGCQRSRRQQADRTPWQRPRLSRLGRVHVLLRRHPAALHGYRRVDASGQAARRRTSSTATSSTRCGPSPTAPGSYLVVSTIFGLIVAVIDTAGAVGAGRAAAAPVGAAGLHHQLHPEHRLRHRADPAGDAGAARGRPRR